MKTKLTFQESENLKNIRIQLAMMYSELSEEWSNDRDKDGYCRMHSKCKKALDQTEYAFKAIGKILELIKKE